VDIDELGLTREQAFERDVVHNGRASPIAFGIRLYRRERVLNLLCSTVLVVGVTVFASTRFLFGAGARMDVSEVERVGLGQIAHFEPYEDPVRSVLEGGRAANAGVMLGAQFELYVIAVGGVAMLVGLGTAIGAAD